MRTLFTSLAFAGVVLLAACGGGGSAGAAPPTATATPDPTLPQEAAVGGQNIWETKSGLPLYVSSADTAGVSNCTGNCAVVWPPLLSGSGSVATGAFTIVTRSNGSQWAYAGQPLYTFESDSPGNAPTGNHVSTFTLAVVSGQAGAPTSPPGCSGPYC